MLVHSVFFYLKPELTETQRADFLSGVATLKTIASVEAAYLGAPAGVPLRPVIERGYQVGLTVLFKDLTAHNAYQIDPVHLAFVETYKHCWTKVQVFDTE